jgi:hypothetical protein
MKKPTPNNEVFISKIAKHHPNCLHYQTGFVKDIKNQRKKSKKKKEKKRKAKKKREFKNRWFMIFQKLKEPRSSMK